MLKQTQLKVSEHNLENLDFEVTLSGTYWGNRNPAFTIAVDNNIVVDSTITAFPSKKGLPGNDHMTAERELGTYQTEKFTVGLTPGSHVLSISLKGKLPSDTCGFDSEGRYINDVLLNVEKITIDGMDLHNLLFEESEYCLDEPSIVDGQTVDKLHHCVHLGFNGTYKLTFSTPFYIWLLERL